VEPPATEEERPDVAAVVDDLLGGEGAMTEASAVMSEDARLAEAVRAALAETPGLLSSPIDIEVEAGHVTLYGELDRPEAIEAVERKAESVDGVRELRSLLHLPGTPAPESR
jgi:osmotically-inducible protein OsmY